MTAIYDKIGQSYSSTRAADPRITSHIIELLGLLPGSRILDIGAGTGNYSCALAECGYEVTALEPSEVMRAQGKQHPNLSWQAGYAEKLPFDNSCFDGILMTLCMHHFTDWRKALSEATRVVGSGPIVILSFDAERDSNFWLLDYFPSFMEKDRETFPKLSEMVPFVEESLSRTLEVEAFPLPSDLKDNFLAAGWAHPEIYLNETYRSGISSFSAVDQVFVDQGLQRLEADLQSGEWLRQYGPITQKLSLDVGYVFLRF